MNDPEKPETMICYAGVYANTTVTEYLDFFARAHDLRGEARRKAVDHIIDFMDAMGFDRFARPSSGTEAASSAAASAGRSAVATRT